jgi:hypothetical protein
MSAVAGLTGVVRARLMSAEIITGGLRPRLVLTQVVTCTDLSGEVPIL